MKNKTPKATLNLDVSGTSLAKPSACSGVDLLMPIASSAAAGFSEQESLSCDPNRCSEMACQDGFLSEGSLTPNINNINPHQPIIASTLSTPSSIAKHSSLSALRNSNGGASMIPLSGGSPGARYSVVRLCSNHLSHQDDDLKRRLQMYGVVPGTELIIDRIAPLGDPITLRVRGTELALRRREAACIIVAPCVAENNLGTESAALSISVRGNTDSNNKVASNL